MSVPHGFLRFVDRILAIQLVAVITGTALAFGGAVWWMKPALAVMTVGLATTALIRSALIGRLFVLKSPLTAIGVLALGLSAVQIVPLPGRIASMLSHNSRSAHALGTLPDQAKHDDSTAEIAEIVADRSAASVDRPATLRWAFGAAACLAVFCVCAHYSDRLKHATMIWGSVVAVFFVGTTFSIAQLLGGASGLYGMVEPGTGRPLAPSLADLSIAPGSTLLGPISESTIGSPWVVQRPVRSFLLGSMMGGPSSYLALAALGFPLAFGLMLHTLAPRGSREGLSARLRASNRSGLAMFLILMTAISAPLIGYLSGPILAVPFGLALIAIGLPASWASGLRWVSLGLTAAMLVGISGGVALGETWGRATGVDAVAASTSWESARQSWSETARAIRQFPLVGSGMGSYATITSYVKTTDATPTTARSSFLQWGVESGLCGLILLGMAAIWCFIKLPGAIRRVGSADKTLAYMLFGTMGCFALASMAMSTIEVFALALAACAVAGTANRWLAGGTDLFVEAA